MFTLYPLLSLLRKLLLFVMLVDSVPSDLRMVIVVLLEHVFVKANCIVLRRSKEGCSTTSRCKQVEMMVSPLLFWIGKYNTYHSCSVVIKSVRICLPILFASSNVLVIPS